MSKPVDLTGQRFGRLTALEPTGRRSGSCIVWRCRCDCGNDAHASVENLRKGHVTSCGCWKKEVIRTRVAPLGKAARARNYVQGTCITTLIQPPGASNTSGAVGVRWHKGKGKWIADIQFKGKRYYLGSGADKDFLIALRKEAEQRIHGNFLEWYYSKHPERKPKDRDFDEPPI